MPCYILNFKTNAQLCTEIQNTMNIVSHKRLFDFYQKFNEAEVPLENWFKTAKKAKWRCFADIKKDFNSADQSSGHCPAFNPLACKNVPQAPSETNIFPSFIRSVILPILKKFYFLYLFKPFGDHIYGWHFPLRFKGVLFQYN